jgi:isochorismate pyruvate lyase
MKRRGDRVFSGAPWEARVGYCRAVRAGKMVFVAGTTAVAADGSVQGPGDGYVQAARCFEIAVAALRKLGAAPSDVVRTRMFVTDASRWAEFGRAHAEAFGAHPPAATMVEVRALIDPAMLIEVEVDAVIRARRAPARTRAGAVRS